MTGSRLRVLRFSLFAISFSLLFRAALADVASPAASTVPPAATPPKPEDMEVQIKGQFKGRLLVKKISAPVTMNLEKLQDFPEDPSQKILLDPLPISQSVEFNGRNEVKGHAPFVPWIPALPEPPFLRLVPPALDPKAPPLKSWIFEVLNPQGQTIYRQRGTNGLPDELIWEGKDSEKQFAVVDRLYSAQLTLLGNDDKAATITGNSVVLPAMMYGSEDSQTIEVSLDRLFKPDKSEISPEGVLMLSKVCEHVRELGLEKIHLRIAGLVPSLSEQRETALAAAMEKALILVSGSVEHDHIAAADRGEIAVFWLKTGATQ